MDRESIQAGLGADLPIGSEQITIFIPNRDAAGRRIDQKKWLVEALRVLGSLFRGATAFPPGDGVWKDGKGELIFEKTRMGISHAPEAELVKSLPRLKSFLHRFGREANQGEVGLVINMDYYGISNFDRE